MYKHFLCLFVSFCILLCSGCSRTEEAYASDTPSLIDRVSHAYVLLHTHLFGTWQSPSDSWAEQITNTITKKDSEQLLQLFSESTRVKVRDLPEQIEELYAFIEGDVIKTDSSPGGRTTSTHGGFKEYFKIPIEIETAEEKYRIAVEVYAEYAGNDSFVGITSLYIINEKDINPQFTYWGGGADEWNPGIMIEKQN